MTIPIVIRANGLQKSRGIECRIGRYNLFVINKNSPLYLCNSERYSGE
jgi:hypothetical protein